MPTGSNSHATCIHCWPRAECPAPTTWNWRRRSSNRWPNRARRRCRCSTRPRTIDGRVHKIAEAVDVDFDPRDVKRPWRIRTRGSRRVDLTFVPITVRPVTVPPVLQLRQCMGRFAGTVVDDAGTPIALDGVLGLAESVRGRW